MHNHNYNLVCIRTSMYLHNSYSYIGNMSTLDLTDGFAFQVCCWFMHAHARMHTHMHTVFMFIHMSVP